MFKNVFSQNSAIRLVFLTSVVTSVQYNISTMLAYIESENWGGDFIMLSLKLFSVLLTIQIGILVFSQALIPRNYLIEAAVILY